MLMMERNEKLENVALWIKNLESDVTEMKAERENLAQREKVALKKAESLKRWLTASLEGTRFSTPRVAVSCRNSKSVDVEDVYKRQNIELSLVFHKIPFFSFKAII